MTNIQHTLESLQPYFIGIRYVEGTPVVDAVFKDGWTVPTDDKIKTIKGDETMNYYMLFSESPNIGVDGLLSYMDKVIKLNLDREKKHELLLIKVEELKQIFKKNTLDKLKKLTFSFSSEDLVPKLSEFNLDLESDSIIETPIKNDKIYEEEIVEEIVEEKVELEKPPTEYLDEHGNKIELTEEELEIIEEEARAERNRQIIKNREKHQTPVKKAGKVELPPKKKQEVVMGDGYDVYDNECDCGPNEACSKCMDNKDY